ncbi:ABC transporter substrate-binding protein [Pseudomonas alcaligenes]|uniref:ABC transporter substrate-binding protein n=1 Tax=Aquipseudomonas alcaligenes TaxID=43263 RepID=A0ABR7S4P1_AQUAC|nr:transporter substrate-binding domain-containing protein [Pseudomonas alcaligenes]MBC9251566.1 ABC transporter substrate-binding protein [Pseudomonas alcaligenes]
MNRAVARFSPLQQRARSTALFLLLVLLPLAAPACEKTLRWDDDPPFSMQLPNGEIGGIYVDINRAALARLGCQARLVKLPWARALKELENGRLDVLPGAFRKPEREVYAYFSGKVLSSSRNILFMRQDALVRWPVRHLQELKDTPFRLGAQTNVSYGDDYQQLMSQPAFAARVSFNASRHNLWLMIDKHRIDGLIADESSGAYELKQLGLSERIRPTAVVVSSEAAEVAFSKETTSEAFVRHYADALRQLVGDGSYARIRHSYLGQ